jgi:hypothetical protein
MALDTFCYGEDNRYFKGIDASEFRGRFAHLLGLSSAQVALVESGLKGKQEASRLSGDVQILYLIGYSLS